MMTSLSKDEIERLIGYQHKSWSKMRAKKRMDNIVSVGMAIFTITFFIVTVSIAFNA